MSALVTIEIRVQDFASNIDYTNRKAEIVKERGDDGHLEAHLFAKEAAIRLENMLNDYFKTKE